MSDLFIYLSVSVYIYNIHYILCVGRICIDHTTADANSYRQLNVKS